MAKANPSNRIVPQPRRLRRATSRINSAAKPYTLISGIRSQRVEMRRVPGSSSASTGERKISTAAGAKFEAWLPAV
jgi:hypothetical protein